MSLTRCLFALLALAFAGPAMAQGNLAVKPEKLPILEIGLGDTGYGISQADFELVTGKAYTLTIKSTGAKECAWVAPEWAHAVWLRKIEIEKVEIKAQYLYELEMEEEGEADIFFVPIIPGEYTWRCKGLEGKGMTGKFIVK